jgi:hypothetical protein
LLAFGGAILVAASLVHNWLDYLDGHQHPVPSSIAYLLWIAVALVGFAAAAIAYSTNKYGATRATTELGGWAGRGAALALRTVSRFVVGPAVAIAGGTEDWSPRRDDAMGESMLATGRFVVAFSRAPVIAAAIALAVLLAVTLALVSPGLFR